jgi:hypothetical protein
MYAQVTNREAYPLGWEQSEWLFKKLKRLTFDAQGYQFVWERRLFALHWAPETRALLVKWRVENGQKIREVIVETDDQQVMASALTMLVAVAEDEMKARGEVTHGVKWL